MALILSGDTGPGFVQAAAEPTGSVIQVVMGTLTSQFTLTTSYGSFTNMFSATITPQFSTSKILIFVSVGVYPTAVDSRQQVVS